MRMVSVDDAEDGRYCRTDLATTKLYRNDTTITPHLNTAQVDSALEYE
jgi:hypothetical protein